MCFWVLTRRLAVFFEPLNSSLPLLVPELRAHKAMCDSVGLARESSKEAGRQSIKLNQLASYDGAK